MMFRTPEQRDSTLNKIDEESEPYVLGLRDWLQTIANSSSPLSKKASSFLEQIGRRRLQDIVDPQETWEGMLNPEKYPKTRQAVFSMHWHFFVHRDRVFLTCDNPCFFFRSLGLAHRDAEVTFPISSNIALLATWKQRTQNAYSAPKDSTVQQINRRSVANASRLVFSHDFVDWKFRLANKQHIAVHKLL
jgi:hypothetical protein